MLDEEFEQNYLGKGRIETSAFFIAIIFCVFLTGFFVISHFLNINPDYLIELEKRINPNVAEKGSLVRLPGIGDSKAVAIVSYRERFAGEQKKPVFKKAVDLKKVKGIGEKTIEKMQPWLKFE